MAKKNFEELDCGATEEDSSEVAKYDLLVKRDQVSGRRGGAATLLHAVLIVYVCTVLSADH